VTFNPGDRVRVTTGLFGAELNGKEGTVTRNIGPAPAEDGDALFVDVEGYGSAALLSTEVELVDAAVVA
jgi:hypothetical protein